jgi:hypothetical protein
MRRHERKLALPSDMQGRWIAMDEPSFELFVDGGEVTCGGQRVEYDYKEVEEVAGAIIVTLRVSNTAQEDTFQRANITGLVITPDGEFHAYNVKFASQFIRAHETIHG